MSSLEKKKAEVEAQITALEAEFNRLQEQVRVANRRLSEIRDVHLQAQGKLAGIVEVLSAESEEAVKPKQKDKKEN